MTLLELLVQWESLSLILLSFITSGNPLHLPFSVSKMNMSPRTHRWQSH
ncbi:hypothetical protein MGM_06042 [Candida albicans P75063]|nr:hypothetical protein MGM_06042 [Candida albicans P75063]